MEVPMPALHRSRLRLPDSSSRFSLLVIGLLLACRSSPPTREQTISAGQKCDVPNKAVVQYDATVASAPLTLVAMMKAFPKGGDLHNHLSGSIMPEDYITMGIADGDCYGPATKDRKDPKILAIKTRGKDGTCETGDQRLSVLKQPEWDDLVRSLSMDRFAYPSIQAGHDQFFATFSRFGAVSGSRCDRGKMLAKMLVQAEMDSVSYVETVVSFQGTAVTDMAEELHKEHLSPEDYGDSTKWEGIVAMVKKAGLDAAVKAAREDLSLYLAVMRDSLGCATAPTNPGCSVALRFHADVNRNSNYKDEADHKEKPDYAKMFTQAALAFALAAEDERVVGVNLLSGEDLPYSMKAFPTQMKFLGTFHTRYPKVSIALHGGELTPCFVGSGNPALLTHLTESIAAGAKRIGHGVSFAYLDPAQKQQVASLMLKENVLVEIALASNAQILGVAGAEHPFTQYFRDYKVPAAMATDDEGVSYANFTSEWVYAYLQYHLSYAEAVRLARLSLQHSFLPGQSLWQGEAGEAIVSECQTVAAGSPVSAESACGAFLNVNAKAKLQWDLEARLVRFRKNYGTEQWQ
jgi:hypothetical protein